MTQSSCPGPGAAQADVREIRPDKKAPPDFPLGRGFSFVPGHQGASRLDHINVPYPVASWFEARGLAALLTMRVSDLILRSHA